jgi:hypothetical protein
MTHRYWLLSLSIVALLCVPLVGWGASIVITVPPEAQVQGPQIILGDVAEIQGEPADTVARMRQVLLGQAPPAGGGAATLKEHARHPTQTPGAVDAGTPIPRSPPEPRQACQPVS